MIRRQANLPMQLELFPPAGACPTGSRRLLADNENDPFAWSAPRHSGGVDGLAFGFVPGMEQTAPLKRIGLSLADHEARIGPGAENPDGERD